jgi:hypothetical protein
MSDITHPDPSLELDHPTKTYYQLVHTLTSRLPPPVADTPEALLARNHAALAQVAAMLPVNAHEAGLAVQCVAARAQAEDAMRLIRLHDGDIKTVIKLNAQYIGLVRTSLGAHGHLLRAQAVRHKREQCEVARNVDEWTQHIAARWMQQTLDAGPVPAVPQAAPALGAGHVAPMLGTEEPPAPAPVADPPAPAHEPAPVAHPPASLPESAQVRAAAPASAAAPTPSTPAPATEDQPPPAPAAEEQPPPAAPVPAPAPQRSRRIATPAEPGEPPRDLPTEADHYAMVYPRRAREMRHHGGLPSDCSYGPPDDDLVHAIVTGSSPTLRAIDRMGTAAV